MGEKGKKKGGFSNPSSPLPHVPPDKDSDALWETGSAEESL